MSGEVSYLLLCNYHSEEGLELDDAGQPTFEPSSGDVTTAISLEALNAGPKALKPPSQHSSPPGSL